MLHQQRKHGHELVLGELVAERVQVFDGVDGKNGVDGARSSLEIGKDILPEEVNNVNEDIDGGDAALDSRATRGNGGEEVDGGVLALPVLLRVLVVLLKRQRLSNPSQLTARKVVM